jgi:hypothetical protein
MNPPSLDNPSGLRIIVYTEDRPSYQQFTHLTNEGLPLPERFRGAFAVNGANLEKVLDS